jgi:5-methylcytosine-specific restriction endonuclease McrA
MSKITDNRYVAPLQRKRYLSLQSHVFGALQIKEDDVGTIANMVQLVNDVYESSIVYAGDINIAIDAMWGWITGLTKSKRKKLRSKNLHKIEYPMGGHMGQRRDAKRFHISFHSDQAAAKRKAADTRVLEAVKAKKLRPAKTVSVTTKDAFYKSWEWRTLRMEAIKEFGRACQCCGAEPGMKDAAGNPVRIVVDHIKPISKYWHLRLDRKNLQILCDECNMGKGNWDETDFRSPEAPDEWVEAPQEDIVLSVLDEMGKASIQ